MKTSPAWRDRAGSPIRWSLRAKVFFVALAICLVLVGSLTAFFGRASIAEAGDALANKALDYGKLAGKQLEPAVEFADHDAAREVLGAIVVDDDVAAAGLFSADGTVIERSGDVSFTAADSGAVVVRTRTHIRSAVPVVSSRGTRGIVVIEMSLRELERRRQAVEATAATVMAVGVLLALLVAWAGGRYLTARLGVLVRNAASVARGELDHLEPLREGSDEIGELSNAFGVMTTNLKKLIGENERRTIEIGESNVQMRTVLDHVAQGFLTIDRTGEIGPQRSASVARWFGEMPAALSFKDLLARADEDTALWFELGWEAVVDGILPLEVALQQLPKKLAFAGRTFALEVTPISTAAEQLTALVVITDVTERLERERSNAARAEVLGVLERALEDRAGLMEFLDEAGTLVDALVRHHHMTSLGDAKRALHTLKGTCALFGLSSVSTFCHELETRIADLNDLPSPSDLRELEARWTSATSSLVRVFAKTSKDTLEVSRADIDDLVTAASSGAARQELGRRARLLRLEPMSMRLSRISDSATSLAARLQKRIQVNVDGGNVRFDAAAWAPFWAAFTHVLRNAIDHGIEDAEERASLGKPRTGQLMLAAAIEDASFILRVSDDGRGVDWPTVARKAAVLGAPCRTHADLEAALFIDGLSSKSEVTDVSGRGIGLGAVKTACNALQGHLHVASVASEGTTFTFVFPVVALGDAYARVMSNRMESSVA